MDDEWISAADAYRLVKDATNIRKAAGLICSRANDQLIATKARRLVVDDLVEDDIEIPSQFWWKRGDLWLAQDWTTGDFETVSHRRERCRAYGVEFLKSDIEAMLPTRGGAQAATKWAPGNYMPANVCMKELMGSLRMDAGQVSELILRNCRAGLVPARCKSLWSRETDRYGSTEQAIENTAIPLWVWEECLNSPDAVLNWPANVFAGEGVVGGDQCKVKVVGVEFEIGAIIDVERLAQASASSVQEAAKRAVPVSGSKGRKLSELWPHWVAELAATIHNEGLPAGEGSQGQEELIRRVADALALRGLEGPSRATVQPVIQAVLDRLRAADN